MNGGGVLTLTSSVDDVTQSNGDRLFDIILSGSNSNGGGTQVIGVSYVTLDATNALGTGSLDVGADAWVALAGNYSQSVSTLSGSGAIFANGLRASNGSGAATLTVQSGTFSGILADGHSVDQGMSYTGTLALIKAGTGTLTLTGQNDYSGGTQLQDGVLEIGRSNALGTGTLSMSDGTTLRVAQSANQFANGIRLDNAITLSGNDTVDTQNVTGGLGLHGVISGTGTLIKTGSTGLGIYAENSYSGGTQIEAGHITVDVDGALGSGTVTFAGGFLRAGVDALTVTNAATLSSDGRIDTQSYSLTYAGQISGLGALIKTGTGTLTLSNTTSNYSGGTQIGAGTVAVTNSSSLGTGAVNLSGGGILQADVGNNGLTLSNPIVIGATGGTIDSNGANYLALAGNISSNSTTGPLIFTGTNGDPNQLFRHCSVRNQHFYRRRRNPKWNTGRQHHRQWDRLRLAADRRGGRVCHGRKRSGRHRAHRRREHLRQRVRRFRYNHQYSERAEWVLHRDPGEMASATNSSMVYWSATTGLVGAYQGLGRERIGRDAHPPTGASYYSGGTQLQAGTIAVANFDPLGTGVIAMSNNTTIQTVAGARLTNNITLTGTDTFDMSGTGNPAAPYSGGMAITGNISGSGELVKDRSPGPAARRRQLLLRWHARQGRPRRRRQRQCLRHRPGHLRRGISGRPRRRPYDRQHHMIRSDDDVRYAGLRANLCRTDLGLRRADQGRDLGRSM